ncbi:hypothetical protein YYC_02398 [Plasmodium yoelii 17X]|uniref:Uncharacterized protein n=1 Tax=Plasmodium yoelii 17X TaxID=1323249 RepID=V7PM21_PLAYE|nr:hypothetical protein YYC_02398 [Plasmodium yoelii 17X]
MNENMCSKFLYVRTNFTYQSNSRNYTFLNDKLFKEYCDNEKCETNIDKISAACLFLLNEFFGSSDLFSYYAKNNINIVEYVIIWLSYMLTQMKDEKMTSLNEFYTKHIENGNRYKKAITGVSDCTNYKDVIDKKKDLLNMDMKIISKFYDAFQTLCSMYNQYDGDKTNWEKELVDAQKFIGMYKKLNNDPSITEDSPYYQLLTTLSTDYDNFKKKCNKASCSHFEPLPAYSRSSVTKNTLIPIAFIFVAVSIVLGIAYKVNNKEFKNIAFLNIIFIKYMKLFIIWISETISKTKIKRKNKKYKEENESIIYDSKSSDYFRNSNND